MPCVQVWNSSDTIDAAVRPEIDQDDLAAQIGKRERTSLDPAQLGPRRRGLADDRRGEEEPALVAVLSRA